MDRILSLIGHYGYLVILFGVMLESTGVPLPGETILLASGLLVQRGYLDLGDAIVFGILGAVVGDQIGSKAPVPMRAPPEKGCFRAPTVNKTSPMTAARVTTISLCAH